MEIEQIGNYIHQWQSVMENDRVKSLIETSGFSLFFIHESQVFGANESNRLIFATMKTPDEDTTPAWLHETNLMANNLTMAMIGKSIQKVFKYRDIKDIHVITKEEAIKILSNMNNKIKK